MGTIYLLIQHFNVKQFVLEYEIFDIFMKHHLGLLMKISARPLTSEKPMTTVFKSRSPVLNNFPYKISVGIFVIFVS